MDTFIYNISWWTGDMICFQWKCQRSFCKVSCNLWLEPWEAITWSIWNATHCGFKMDTELEKSQSALKTHTTAVHLWRLKVGGRHVTSNITMWSKAFWKLTQDMFKVLKWISIMHQVSTWRAKTAASHVCFMARCNGASQLGSIPAQECQLANFGIKCLQMEVPRQT